MQTPVRKAIEQGTTLRATKKKMQTPLRAEIKQGVYLHPLSPEQEAEVDSPVTFLPDTPNTVARKRTFKTPLMKKKYNPFAMLEIESSESEPECESEAECEVEVIASTRSSCAASRATTPKRSTPKRSTPKRSTPENKPVISKARTPEAATTTLKLRTPKAKVLAPRTPESRVNVESFTVKVLRAELTKLGKPTNGLKKELVARLKVALEPAPPAQRERKVISVQKRRLSLIPEDSESAKPTPAKRSRKTPVKAAAAAAAAAAATATMPAFNIDSMTVKVLRAELAKLNVPIKGLKLKKDLQKALRIAMTSGPLQKEETVELPVVAATLGEAKRTEISSPAPAVDFSKMKVVDLRKHLASIGASTSGLKKDLVARCIAACTSNSESKPEAEVAEVAEVEAALAKKRAPKRKVTAAAKSTKEPARTTRRSTRSRT